MTASLLAPLRAGDRRALARAITLVESTHPDDEVQACALVDEALPHTGTALRIGISGTPGAGKSTFIEVLGMRLCEAGHRVAVLAIDPSSNNTHGSVLGDRTRMERLCAHPNAYVRPSPSSGVLGGTAPRTHEAVLLVEAAGYDVVIIETVGIGQNEAAVRELVDTFVLVLAPAGGDGLQGVKRGVLEHVDVVVINKNDGDHKRAAADARAAYAEGLSLLGPHRMQDGSRFNVPVLLVSSQEGTGIDEVQAAIDAHTQQLEQTGTKAVKRTAQARAQLWHHVEHAIARLLHQRAAHDVADVETAVAAHALSPLSGARRLLELFAPKPR